jgi:hypothetical protein
MARPSLPTSSGRIWTQMLATWGKWAKWVMWRHMCRRVGSHPSGMGLGNPQLPPQGPVLPPFPGRYGALRDR